MLQLVWLLHWPGAKSFWSAECAHTAVCKLMEAAWYQTERAQRATDVLGAGESSHVVKDLPADLVADASFERRFKFCVRTQHVALALEGQGS